MPKSKEFLSSSDSENSGSDEPKPKKKKKPESKKESKPESKPVKDEKESVSKAAAGKPQKDAGGEYKFELSRMRFATVSEFRGKVMVGIREYYEKDGEMRPGKKGISLSADQWKALKGHVDDIDEACKDF